MPRVGEIACLGCAAADSIIKVARGERNEGRREIDGFWYMDMGG